MSEFIASKRCQSRIPQWFTARRRTNMGFQSFRIQKAARPGLRRGFDVSRRNAGSLCHLPSSSSLSIQTYHPVTLVLGLDGAYGSPYSQAGDHRVRAGDGCQYPVSRDEQTHMQSHDKRQALSVAFARLALQIWFTRLISCGGRQTRQRVRIIQIRGGTLRRTPRRHRVHIKFQVKMRGGCIKPPR